MISVEQIQLVQVNDDNFQEVLETYSVVKEKAARALSFAYHYDKILFLDVKSKLFVWQERPGSS